jgi:peptidase A4-like protein/galactose oxidase-like protein
MNRASRFLSLKSLLLIIIVFLSSTYLLSNLPKDIRENYSFTPPIGGPPPSTPAQRWMNLTSTLSVSPGDRSLASVVYDEADGYHILFGGWDGARVLGDTWTFQGGAWRNITSLQTVSPSPRMSASITYDAVDRYVVLFGGSTLPGGQGTVYGDTWIFETGSWKQIGLVKSPAPRSDSSMSYDLKDGYAVLFGGNNHGLYLGDTWEFKGGTWTSISTTESPSARALEGMTYDPLDHYILLYGGATNSTGTVADSNETWSFVGGSWSQLPTPVSPGGRDSVGIAYYPSLQSVLMFGGRTSACGPDLGDTWEFQMGAWTQASPVSSPPASQGMTLSFSPATDTVILFGGETSRASNPTSQCESGEFNLGLWDYTTFLQVLSTNWAGYAVSGPNSSVTDVKGSWIVPAVVGACPPGDALAGFWVGIDGFNSNTVEQTGTASGCTNGRPTYFAWFEFFPKNFHKIGFINITPGDVISAEVRYDGSFTITLSDITIGRTFMKSVTGISAQRSSAEWIVEAPSSKNGTLPLADFGRADFGMDETGVTETCFLVMNNTQGSIGLFSQIQQITMISPSGILKTQLTDLSSDGTSFSVRWASAGP